VDLPSKVLDPLRSLSLEAASKADDTMARSPRKGVLGGWGEREGRRRKEAEWFEER